MTYEDITIQAINLWLRDNTSVIFPQEYIFLQLATGELSIEEFRNQLIETQKKIN